MLYHPKNIDHRVTDETGGVNFLGTPRPWPQPSNGCSRIDSITFGLHPSETRERSQKEFYPNAYIGKKRKREWF
jgi:hypothetical protein